VLLVNVGLPGTAASREERPEVYRELLERFRSLPGVRSASASNTTPISGGTWNNTVAVEGYSPASPDDALVFLNEVSDDYFATMRTEVVAGRDFDRSDDSAAQRVALINVTMARRFFGQANPIGREFLLRLTGDDFLPPIRIIGVVEDAKYESLREAPVPTAYLSLAQNRLPSPGMTYELLSTGAAEALIPGVRDAVETMDPTISLEFATLEAQVSSSLTRERMLAVLSGFFGVLALILALIGIYGTISYGVARRRREIAVRLVLGAAPAGVLRMILAEAGRIVLIGLAIGMVAALVCTRLIASFLFGLSPSDPATIVLAGALLTTAALAASALPAWRAASTDPLIPLREE
jgi:predicted permease